MTKNIKKYKNVKEDASLYATRYLFLSSERPFVALSFSFSRVRLKRNPRVWDNGASLLLTGNWLSFGE